jgi:hypothetical protein
MHVECNIVFSQFEPKMVTISARNSIQAWQKLQTLQDYIFQDSQHFATKSYNFTKFVMFFLAEALDSLIFT